MKKYFTRGRLRLFDIKSGQRVLLIKRGSDWVRLKNDGREQRLSIREVYRLIFYYGAFDFPRKRRMYTSAVFSADRAKFFLEKGFALRDHRLNLFKLENGHVTRNGKIIVALPINERYIIDLFEEKTAEIPTTTVVEKEETYAQGRLRKAQLPYTPSTTKVCIGDEYKELHELKADLEKEERKKVSVPKSEEEESSLWYLLPIAASGLVGLGILWKLIKGTDNNNINKLVYA